MGGGPVIKEISNFDKKNIEGNCTRGGPLKKYFFAASLKKYGNILKKAITVYTNVGMNIKEGTNGIVKCQINNNSASKPHYTGSLPNNILPLWVRRGNPLQTFF